MKPCLTPGCPNLAPRGQSYCPTHLPVRKPFEDRYGITRAKWFRLVRRVFRRDRYTCTRCGRSRDRDGVALECDHRVPRELGGSNSMSNLQTLCHDCHTEKTTADRKAMRDGKPA